MRKMTIGLLVAAVVLVGGAGFAVSQFAPQPGGKVATASSPAYTTVKWEDLIPASVRSSTTEFSGTVTHEQIAELEKAKQSASALQLRTDLDGQNVMIDGFLLPIAMQGTAVSDFLLVPFVGACIHVPPPPANQIVFVHIDGGVQVRGMFDLVRVRGTMSAKPVSTDLAQVGYQITASDVDLQDQPA